MSKNEPTPNAADELLDDGFLGADVEVEDQAFGSAFPLVLWVNGSPQGKAAGEDSIAHLGGFFIGADQGIEPPPGFKPCNLLTTEGEEVPGFWSRDLCFSPIRIRRAWRVDPGEGQLMQLFAHSDYEAAETLGKPRGVCHVVAGIEGVDDAVMISFRGMTAKAMMGQGKERGIIPEYGARIIRAAKMQARKAKRNKAFPLCTFRLTVGPARDEKGKPVFTKVGQGSQTRQITMPTWLDEPSGLVTKPHLNRLYVGNETFATYQAIHRECDEWWEAWSAEKLSRNTRDTAGVPADTDKGELPGDQEIPF